MSLSKETIFLCLKSLIRPAVRFCLRHGITIQDITEATKVIMIQEAEIDTRKRKDKINDSRMSVMTGIHRRDVTRLRDEEFNPKESISLAARVIGHWQQNETYKGRPLSYGFDQSDFTSLCRDVSKDLHPQSIVVELLRSENAIEKDGLLYLQDKIFNPKRDIESSYHLLSNDNCDLAMAVEENIFESSEIPNLHIRTEYDKVTPAAEGEIKKWILEKGEAVQAQARTFISDKDMDINPKLANDSNKNALRVVFGTYSYIEKIDISVPEVQIKRGRGRPKKNNDQ